jgi:hypothetical protein
MAHALKAVHVPVLLLLSLLLLLLLVVSVYADVSTHAVSLSA